MFPHDQERTGKPVELNMLTKCAWAGLHTSDRLLLEAVREFKVVGSYGESDRRS